MFGGGFVSFGTVRGVSNCDYFHLPNPLGAAGQKKKKKNWGKLGVPLSQSISRWHIGTVLVSKCVSK